MRSFNFPLPEHWKKAFFDAEKCEELRSAIRTDDNARVSQLIRRHRNPVVADITDVQPWMYYDRLVAAKNTSPGTLLFFTTPLSSTKSKLDTNLKQAGRLPDPKHFLVMSMRFIFDPVMLVLDIRKLMLGYYTEFEIGDKIYSEGHFDLFPGGAGIAGSSADTTTRKESVWNNGCPTPMAVNAWGTEHGIHILQGQTFQVRAQAPTTVTLEDTNGEGMDLRCVLDGILYREVQ